MRNIIIFIVLVMIMGVLSPPVCHGLTANRKGEISMLFRPPKTRRNPVTGKKERVRNAKGEIVLSEKYSGQWVDYTGRRKTRALSTSKPQAAKMLEALKVISREIKLGLRPVPSVAEKNKARLFRQVANEWLEWGNAQGGRGGRPWAPIHQRSRQRQIELWESRLKFKYLNDLDGCLGKVEKAIRDLLAEGMGKKTIANNVEGLRALVLWCMERRYLAENPLIGLSKLDKTPKVRKRLPTKDEISRVMAVAPVGRRMTYRVASETGLRANELRNIRIHHLDIEQGGIRLDPEWTKNRQPGFQPISKALLADLVKYAKERKAEKEYEAAFRRGGHEGAWPENPLLYVPRNCASSMDRDLVAAGIPKVTVEGKIDFHCWRNVFINNVIATGADVKTVQALARHSSPELSFNVYGRSNKERLASAVEEASRRMYFGLTETEESTGGLDATGGKEDA